MWMHPGVIAAAATVVSYVKSFYDDFIGTGGAGTLHGRVKDGLTWTVNPGSTTNTGALGLDGSGHLSGALTSTGGASNSIHGYIPFTMPASQTVRVVRRSNPSASANPFAYNTDCPAYLGSSLWDKILPNMTSGNGVNGTFTVRYLHSGLGNAAGSVLIQNQGITQVYGDSVETEYYNSGGTWFMNARQNGKLIVNAQSLAAIGFNPNGNFGYRGDMPASFIDDQWVGDPGTQALIRLYRPARTAQTRANGDVVMTLEGTYEQSAPSAIYITLRNSTNTANITGYVDVPLSNFSASTGTYMGTFTLAAADVPAAGFLFQAKRTDNIAGGGSEIYVTGLNKAGEVIMLNGQSLQVLAYQATSGGSAAAVADAWRIDGTDENATTEEASRIQRTTTLSPNNELVNAFVTGMGVATPTSIVLGGHGGKNTGERNPGSAYHTNLRAGLVRAGRKARSLIEIGGQYDNTAPLVSSYDASLDSQIDDLETITGETITVLLCPVSSVWNFSTDAIYESLRYKQWMMCNSYPAHPNRYKLGPYTLDIQHGSNDEYHYTNAGWAEQYRRVGLQAAFALRGKTGFDRTGPKLVSVTKDSDTQATVTFDLNGASALSLDNTTGGASSFTNYRGGLTFAIDSAFATPKIPTNGVVGSVVGTTQTVVYTFAAGAFTGNNVYIRGPYGRDAFNQGAEVSTAKRDSIRNAMGTDASMLRGVFGSETKIPIQPFYQTNGVNYIVSP